MMYHIVDFVDTGDTEVVPASWVHNGRSFWPPYKAREQCNRAIARADPPKEFWEKYNIRIRATKDTFSEARLLLPKALLTSDLQTEDEEDQRPAYKRRKRRGMNRIFESESDQDDNDGSNEATRGKRTRAPLALPTAPTIGPPAVTSSEQPRGNHTRAQLALPAAPTIVPPAVITPAILPPTPSRPELSPSSFQNAATPRVPRVNDQLMCEPILREILTTMETIKQQQQIILLQLQNNLRKPIEVPEVTGIPLKTLEELLNLEQSVAAQGEHKQKLVTYFGLAGGLTIKETVWRIMAKLMTNQLAKQINWRGVHGKYGFEQLVLKDVVLKSVRQNSATASAPDGEIEKYIKRWLQLASDRDGGRRERAMKQANS
nr:uncharacterized protein LOC109953328 [Monopterus albus]